LALPGEMLKDVFSLHCVSTGYLTRLAVMLVSVRFVMCGRFDNCVGILVICVLIFTVFVYCFVYVYLFLFVTSVRTTATE